jgi:hypothetical protein
MKPKQEDGEQLTDCARSPKKQTNNSSSFLVFSHGLSILQPFNQSYLNTIDITPTIHPHNGLKSREPSPEAVRIIAHFQ